MRMYDFRKQLKSGKAQERYLDSLFADDFYIKEATREQERQGIDRIFTKRANGHKYTVQYKADATAARTGNAFIETVSVDNRNIKGWAHTCTADYIFYYVVGVGPIYIVKPKDIRRKLAGWGRKYHTQPIPNKKYGKLIYNTIGLLVPLDELERIAVQVVNI